MHLDAMIRSRDQRIFRIVTNGIGRDERAAVAVRGVDIDAAPLHGSGFIAHQSAPIEDPTNLILFAKDSEFGREGASGLANPSDPLKDPVAVIRMGSTQGNLKRKWLSGQARIAGENSRRTFIQNGTTCYNIRTPDANQTCCLQSRRYRVSEHHEASPQV